MGTGFNIWHFFHDIGEAGMPIGLFLIDYGIIWIPLACALTAIPETRKTGIVMLVGLGLDVIFCDGILKHLAVQDSRTGALLLMGVRFRLPSGSAAAAFTALTALCFSRENNFWKAVLAIACIVVFSGNHALNPTDVVGGMAVGAVFGYAGCKIVEALKRCREKKKYSRTEIFDHT